jgi:hypothetical protein
VTWQLTIEWYSPVSRYKAWIIDLAKRTSSKFEQSEINKKPFYKITFDTDKIDDAYSLIKQFLFNKGVAFFINGHNVESDLLYKMFNCYYDKYTRYYIKEYCKYCPKQSICDKKVRELIEESIQIDRG